MNHNERNCVRSRQPTLPPISHRTLHHPSFLPLYMATDFVQHRSGCNNQTGHPIIPAEFFYSDPTLGVGNRIPNIVNELMVLDCFQLNTPPPVMSACLAPPARPDPFRCAPHSTTDLGSLTFKPHNLHPHPHLQPSQIIVQLTQEEDQAITNLLKLHHQDIMAPHIKSQYPSEGSAPAEGHQLEARCWSDTELEVADTLLSHFSLIETDHVDNTSGASPHETVPLQHKGSELLPASVADADRSFGWGGGCPGCGDAAGLHLPAQEEHSTPPLWLPSLSARGDSSEVKACMMSDSEGEAVFGLLSLGDMVDITQ